MTRRPLVIYETTALRVELDGEPGPAAQVRIVELVRLTPAAPLSPHRSVVASSSAAFELALALVVQLAPSPREREVLSRMVEHYRMAAGRVSLPGPDATQTPFRGSDPGLFGDEEHGSAYD